MIKTLWIDNFKSLNNFQIDFAPFSVIIGNNSVGKSTVLQAIDFLASCVKEDFDIIIERRGQRVSNIKSKLKASSRMQFKTQVELNIAGEDRLLDWEIQVAMQSQKNTLTLYKEQIMDAESQEVYLNWDGSKIGFIKGEADTHLNIMGLNYQSSILKMIDSEKEKRDYPELCALKDFWLKTMSFDMLSPEKMRLSSRGNTDTIGRAGDKLPSFIKSMSDTQKVEFERKINNILQGRIEEVSAKTEGKPGWTLLKVTEQYGKRCVEMSSKDLSDGILRLLAFVAISEIGEAANVMLLDEIENGINVNYSERLIKVLRDITEEKKQQLIVTTHSTAFLDFVDAEEIIYLFRDEESGSTKAVPLFKMPVFKKRLANFYPGEIILNLSNEEIMREIMCQE